VIQAAARNLGLPLRKLLGVGTPRSLQGLVGLLCALYLALIHVQTPLRRLTASWHATAAPALRCLKTLKNQLAPSNPVYFQRAARRESSHEVREEALMRSRRCENTAVRLEVSAAAQRWYFDGGDGRLEGGDKAVVIRRCATRRGVAMRRHWLRRLF